MKKQAMDKRNLLTKEEAVEDLERRIGSVGNQAEFACWLGVTRQYLHDVLKRGKSLSPALGYRRVVMYERLEAGSGES